MKPRDLFGVAVRVLAVWFWTQAAYWAYWSVLKSNGTGIGNPNISAREDVGNSVLYVLLGILVMGGARAFTWLAYGDAPMVPPEAGTTSDSAAQTKK